jgi:hypothetical protein
MKSQVQPRSDFKELSAFICFSIADSWKRDFVALNQAATLFIQAKPE